MNSIKPVLSVALCFFVLVSCRAQSTLSQLSFESGKTTIILEKIDMKGEDLTLPSDVTLKFANGGCFRNGRIIADNTSISGQKQGIFDQVIISGNWNVKYISTVMFKDMSSLNSLKNVFALASNSVDNVLIVESGSYKVAAGRSKDRILTVPSNTEVIINGTITMVPNDFPSYNIVYLKGENIKLHGNGKIVGDKCTHKGKDGEWGMGITLAGCHNVQINGLTVSDCWGDCIYVGSRSTEVYINNCTLEDGRRQGISITSAGNVLIENCVIANVGGTPPGFAIDIEPNKDDTVDSVIIRNVKSIDCQGGFLTWGGARGCLIDNVQFIDCYVEGASKPAYSFNTTNNIKFVNCTSDKSIPPKVTKCNNFVICE